MSSDPVDFDRELSTIHAQMRLIDWRNKHMQAITAQLYGAWPALEAQIDDHVARLSVRKAAMAHASVARITVELLEPWVQEQSRIAAVRAENDLNKIMRELPGDAITSHARIALTTAAGVGLIAASLIAIPSVVSFATVATTSWLIASTSTISAPIILAGGAVVAALSLAGSTVLDKAADHGRNHLAQRIKRRARSAIFAEGLDPSARSILNDTQAAVLMAAQTTLEA